MGSPQFQAREILAIIRRRKLFLILPPVLVTIVCVIGAFTLPRKYESSITIWVQRDEILNPLVSFTMAVQMASEDRLQEFDEIVYSRQTIEAVIDSLGLLPRQATPLQRDQMVDQIKGNVRTDRKGTDSFRITFIDSDPVRAQRGANLFANIFIQTRLLAETRRNENTVAFFDQKVKEYEGKSGEGQEAVISELRQSLQDQPSGPTSLSARISAVDAKIRDAEDRITSLERSQSYLGIFPDAFRTTRGRQALSELERIEIPDAADLHKLVSQYDDLTSRYTGKYPEVQRCENQIVEFLKKLRVVIESELSFQKSQLLEYNKSKESLVAELTHTSVEQKVDQEKESNYNMYHQLYNEMKVKLEQARTAQELGKNAEDAFIIIDPARVPTIPTRPNRMMIIAGGFAAGVFLGFLAAGVAELFDSRVRAAKELEIYGKQVIALLPEVRFDREP